MRIYNLVMLKSTRMRLYSTNEGNQLFPSAIDVECNFGLRSGLYVTPLSG